jgi:eukaryotic-like serine/threonine-protein kinase
MLRRAVLAAAAPGLVLLTAGCGLGGGGSVTATVSLPPPSEAAASATAAVPNSSATSAAASPTATPSPSASLRVVNKADQLLFQTPTRNIACAMAAAGAGDAVRCDVLKRTWRVTPKPATCDFDWGQGMIVTARGADFSCISDSLLGSPDALKAGYGTAYRVPGYECVVLSTDVTCRNTATGHGFTVSRTLAHAF